MRPKFRIEGLDEMDERLRRVGDALQDRDQVVPVLMNALEPVAERARQIVPVRSGKLRDDITVSDQAEGESSNELAAYVGPTPDAYYAADVEMGRPAEISASGREYDATQAHPFMRPAWDEQESEIVHSVADGLTDLLHRAAKG